jgi:hypothetical protein
MTAKAVPERLVSLFQKPESILLALSLVSAATTLITFYDWAFLWGWDSPLIFSGGLLIAALALYPDKWWGYLLAAFLSLLIVYHLSHDMFLEWREYWFAGAGFKQSTVQAVLPIWEPIHAVLAGVILCYATIHLIRHGLRHRAQ